MLTLGALAAPAAARNKDVSTPPPPVFQAVLDCKSVADPAERLACYDRTVGAMATAREAKDPRNHARGAARPVRPVAPVDQAVRRR
jgi:hypothetical protein